MVSLLTKLMADDKSSKKQVGRRHETKSKAGADDTGRGSPGSSAGSSSAFNMSDDDCKLATPKKTKKRVQFMADDKLVRIREIPPRSNSPSSEEDSEESEDEEEGSDEEDESSSSEDDDSDKRRSTLPVIVNSAVKLDSAAKGSYSVSKHKGRSSQIVAQITGVSLLSRARGKRSVLKERKFRKVNKIIIDKPAGSLKPKSKQKTVTKQETEKLLAKRSKHANKLKQTTPSPAKAIAHKQAKCMSSAHKSPRLDERSTFVPTGVPDVSVSAGRLSVDQLPVTSLYKVADFIFPSDPYEELRTRVWTPDSSAESAKSVLHRKKTFAWKMANGDQNKLLFDTPCISPLWENVQSLHSSSKPGFTNHVGM